MPEELWAEVCDIVQQAIPIPKKRNAKRHSGSQEDLQITEKRREAKGKGEKERRYIHLNAEFERRARRDKKAFLNEQCKGKDENNRMGNTKDLFKKIRDTKGAFHAKIGPIKDRNSVDLTEAAEKAMAPHSSTLAWQIPWTEEPGGLQSMGSLRVGHD